MSLIDIQITVPKGQYEIVDDEPVIDGSDHDIEDWYEVKGGKHAHHGEKALVADIVIAKGELEIIDAHCDFEPSERHYAGGYVTSWSGLKVDGLNYVAESVNTDQIEEIIIEDFEDEKYN